MFWRKRLTCGEKTAIDVTARINLSQRLQIYDILINSPTQSIMTVIHVDRIRAATDISYAKAVRKPLEPAFVVYDPVFADIIGNDAAIELVEHRADDMFAHEAGVYVKRTNSVYFTANFQTSDPIACYAVDCDNHSKITKVEYPEVYQANGACSYKDCVLYCSQGDRSHSSALVLSDPVTGTSEVLINNFHGREFNSVNDVVIHHPTGDIWFTDPTYGYEQAFRPPPVLPNQVYRFVPATKEIYCLADGFEMCNGLCFSPDYKTLYVTDTGAVQAHAGPGDGHSFSTNLRKQATIYAYDVTTHAGGSTLSNRRTFAFCDTGIPDGIKCDEAGNVYSGCGDGIHVWDASGKLIGKIVVGGVAANFCFVRGGMWVFGEKTLFWVKMHSKGALVSIECE
ncbi:putative lactonohydrolase, partial [Kockiozyma suomiensis]|uniref:putative lactonohydrolase n=1 Tax=Kockiozyma suomiensis TaxID=1337062 RepID=UPI0033430587